MVYSVIHDYIYTVILNYHQLLNILFNKFSSIQQFSKFYGRLHLPSTPRPQASAFGKPLPTLCGRPYGRPHKQGEI